MRKLILTSTIIFLVVSQLQAQIITDRPDQTESSSTVGVGDFQIESGLLVGFESSDNTTTRQLLAPTNLFRYGITKGIELRFLSQFETLKKAELSIQGISDIEIGTKIQLFKKESSATEIALLSHLIIPTGTNPLSINQFGTINKLSISHLLSNTLGLAYNVGYNYLGQQNGDLTYSVAFGIGVNKKVGLYIEPYGELSNFQNFLLNFDAGLTYLANENLQFDFSFGTGITQNMNYISVGVSWLLKKNPTPTNQQ